uniref:Parietopsin n=1 Tax=Sphaeramia orbicularis TaxID=375764 RepID=A0A673CCB2_9TELE
MDSNSTPWSSSSPPPSIYSEVMTVVPTVFPRLGYSILSFLMPVWLMIVTITNYRGSFFLGHSAWFFKDFQVNYFGLVSLCTLTLLAYERYHVVCKPKAGLKLSIRRSIIGLLFVWVFCLFWAVAPLIGWSSYGPEGVQTSCSLAWEERSWSNYSYLILYTILCFIIPVTVIFYCYYRVLKSMNKLNRSVELQGGRSSKKENDHAITMVLAMIIAFFVCWLPYTALSVVVVVDPELYIPPLLATMPMYFAKTSPVYNPIIYSYPTSSVSITMPSFSIGSLLASSSRNSKTHSKVLPL